MARYTDILTSIEIGSSAIKAAMGGIEKNGPMHLLGYVEGSSDNCVRKGEIIAATAALDRLDIVLNELESMAGKPVTATYLALTGDHFGTVNASGTVPIASADRVISEQDIVVATQNARELSLPPDKFPVHSYQRTYIIDGVRRVRNPLGMVASRLSADIHNIYGDHNRIETLLRLLMNVLGEKVTDIAFSAIAGFHALEHRDTEDHGILFIDIGAGVTEYVLFHDAGCMHSGQVTVGCDHIANDLALGLRLPLDISRKVLEEHGAAVMQSDAASRQVSVPDEDGQYRYVPESNIHKIVELRLQELFVLIRDELHDQKLRGLIGDGVVLGGGGALIPNITNLAQQVFEAPARVGVPKDIPGLEDEHRSPRLLTPIGLLHLGRQFRQMDMMDSQPFHRVVRRELAAIFDLARRAMKL